MKITSSSGESSTYEARDTLTSVHDEKLFAYYGASQLAVVDAANDWGDAAVREKLFGYLK